MIKVTIWKDRMNCLHIFRGYNRKLLQLSKYLIVDKDKKEADLFFQDSYDVSTIMATLSKKQYENLNNGYQINARIDSLYF